jgi:dipeptidyl-peptidase-4
MHHPLTPLRAAAVLIGLIAGQYTSVWAAGEEITVERMFGEPSLYESLPSQVRWLGDGRGVSYLKDIGEGDEKQRGFFIREVPSGDERIVCIADTVAVPDDLSKGDDDKFRIGSYSWDEAGRKVLFRFRGDVFSMEAENGTVIRHTGTDEAEQDPTFSPDGKKVAYSRDNDLYILDIESGEELRLTATGCDTVLNGVLDWVYMEELFTRGNVKAFWWSPDSKRIAFLEFREHPVPEFPLVDWIPVHATHELQRYPKAGDPGPIVRVGIANASEGDIVWSDTDTSDDSYIARVYWLGDSRSVAVEKLNRAQDELTLLFADARSGRTELAVQETSDTWINITYLRHYYENERRFIWGSERDGHSHLYLYNFDGSLIRQLTMGEWEVTELEGVDESKGTVYFTANEKSVLERHLYAIDDKGKKLRRITSEEGTHGVIMSPDNKHFIDRFHTHERPVRVAVMGDDFRALERPIQEFLTIEHDGREFQCMIFKPLDFDPRKKYPVIVYTYGGPGAQVVRKGWSRNHLWHGMMAQRGFIVFSLDNRGAAGYGKAWEDPLLKSMGTVELEDQVAGVEYLKTLPYVDGDNIGIWGWSYGGYMTLMALFKHGDVFKAGTAVAPVSDWHLYDSIYTERYMKRPQDNEEGYEAGSPLNHVDDFDGKLLLMHGDADDNVHFQNTVKTVQKLIKAGKDFDLMFYPQKYHGIGGAAERKFLYNKMTRFFERHLKGDGAAASMHP